MIRLAWNALLCLGFILFLFFTGCTPRQAPIEERVAQAEELLNVGQISGAILILEQCQEEDANRVDVLEPLAFAYAANGDPMLAAMTFMRIAELAPRQPEYFIYAAESLVEAGDTTGAVAPYRRYLEARPKDRAVWVILAEMHRGAGRISESLEAYLAAEQVEPRASQQVAIAELYLQSQNLVQAQAFYARALEGDSDFRDEALLGLLETAVRAKRFSEADALLTQLDAEYPGRVDQSDLSGVRDQLAEWNRRREAAKAALAALQERESALEAAPPEELEPVPTPQQAGSTAAVETQPEGPVAEPPVALAGDAPQGQAATVPAVLQPARMPEATPLQRARQLREQGDSIAAIREYKQALVQNDNQPAVWAELSELYLETGQDRWAQATAKEAVRRAPEDAALALQFLRAAQRTMDPKQLVREMETAYRRFPDNPEVVLILGRVFADMGNTRNARLLYEKFLDLAPAGHPERASVQMELDFLGQ